MVHTIQIKRGTRAQIEAAKAAGQLKDGEPYLITDEDRLAVGTDPSGYSSFAKDKENTDITSLTGLTGPLATAEYIQLELHSAFDGVAASQGRVYYSTDEDCLNICHANGVVEQVGQEFFFPPVLNNSGSTIPNGTLVMATGAQGDKITVAKAVTDGSIDPMFIVGVATVDIVDGSTLGKIVTDGIVRNVDTSSYTVGTVLYPNPLVPGGFTSTRPSAPAIRTPIAIVIRQQQNTGRIYVRMINATKLESIQDVKINGSITNNSTLTYNTSLGVWMPQSALPVEGGGTGGSTFTGYLKGIGQDAFTALEGIPASDITGPLDCGTFE